MCLGNILDEGLNIQIRITVHRLANLFHPYLLWRSHMLPTTQGLSTSFDQSD